MKFYTVIVLSGPEDGTIYPAICYRGKTPLLTTDKNVAEGDASELADYNPNAEYKVGEIDV